MVSALTLALAVISLTLAITTGFFWWRGRASKIDPETVREWQHTDQPSTIESNGRRDPIVEEITDIVNASREDLPDRVRALDEKVRSLQNEVAATREHLATVWLDCHGETDHADGPAVVVADLIDGELEDGKAFAKEARERSNIVLITAAHGDGSFTVGVGDELTGVIDASEVASDIGSIIGGGGGGDETVATGGRASPQELRNAIEAKREELERELENF